MIENIFVKKNFNLRINCKKKYLKHLKFYSSYFILTVTINTRVYDKMVKCLILYLYSGFLNSQRCNFFSFLRSPGSGLAEILQQPGTKELY